MGRSQTFWKRSNLSWVLTILAGAYFMLIAGTAPATAQISIPCNGSAVWTPDIAAYGFSSVDVRGKIQSSNPAVASATRGRTGAGNTGAITIKSNGASGEATITYTIEDFSGKTKKIEVAVVVDCPAPPPIPTITTVVTDCKDCKFEADTLNRIIEVYNSSRYEYTPAQRDKKLAEIAKLRAELKQCEEKKCGPPPQQPGSGGTHPQPPVSQAPPAKHYPQPHMVVTRCKLAECRAIQNKLNADIETFNKAVAAGNTPSSQLDAMLANINQEGQELNACEKKCVPKRAALPTPPPPPAPKPTTEYLPKDQVMMRWTGPNFGAQVSGFAPTLNWTEMLAATGMTTDRATVLGNPGAGIGVTAAFAAAVATPIGGVIADPFVAFDYFNHAVEQPLGGSAFLATKSNYQGTAGVKIGPPVGATGWVYGIAGASILNETLTVANFVPESSSRTTTVPGLALGIGGAVQVPALSSFGYPVAMLVEYEHTLWGTAHFDMPLSWTRSNYAFRRDDDVLKFGFTVFLNSPPPLH